MLFYAVTVLLIIVGVAAVVCVISPAHGATKFFGLRHANNIVMRVLGIVALCWMVVTVIHRSRFSGSIVIPEPVRHGLLALTIALLVGLSMFNRRHRHNKG